MTRWILPAATAAALAASTLLAAGGQQVFVSRQDIVRLDVSVTERGRPVLGLTAADFKVKDNGVEQKVDFIGFDEVPLNVLLTFDVSGSVTGQRLRDLRAAGYAVLDQLRTDDRAAVVSFTHAVVVASKLTGDLATLRSALNGAGASGQTSLVDAAFAAMTLGVGEGGRTLMLVFSDGVDTASWLPSEAVVASARSADLVVFGVTTANLRAPFLKDLVGITGGDLVEVRTTGDLTGTFVKLLTQYRQRYLVAYSPTGVESKGWHRVDVTVARRGASVVARQGYQR